MQQEQCAGSSSGSCHNSKKRKRPVGTKYSKNAFEAFGNRVAKQTNVLHFVQMWGESSYKCQRALDLLDLISESDLPRIKHTYVEPSSFGFECEEDQIEWIPYRGFIQTVVNKEEPQQVWVFSGVPGAPPHQEHLRQCEQQQQQKCVEHYKSVVAYLMREGQFSKNLFDSRYVNGACFKETFEKLYANIDPQFKVFQGTIADFKEELQMMEDNLKNLVYNDLVNQIESKGLLREAPKHFDMDQCASMENLNPLLYTKRQKVDLSALGEDLKKEIAKRFGH